MAFELMQNTLDLIFPTLCLHCRAKTERQMFCAGCIESLELLGQEELSSHRRFINQAVITFAKIGVVESVLSYLKRGLKPLNKIAASYMVCQLEKEGVSAPDILVPFPSKNGYKLNEALALEMGKLFERPIKRLFTPLPISVLGTSLIVKNLLL